MSKRNLPSIPDLRLVPVNDVLPHEEHDSQRSAPLVKRIKDSNVWLNPPIVAPLDSQLEEGQSFALLDGANRYHCVRELGYPHILVQVVNYKSEFIQLETWNHVLSDIHADEILPKIYKLKGIHAEHSDTLTAQSALARREAIAYLRVLPDWVLMLIADTQDIRERNASLRDLVNTYKLAARLDRITGDDPEQVKKVHPNASVVVIFPRYEPAEILVAARDRIHLPPGISRHIIQGRALRLNYPLSELADTETDLQIKNEKLQQWVQERFATKNVRFYEESMFIYDD
ncbi:MAG: hypothetical protein K8I82_03935 [Anaerolineae bacterium]|nr:hypothetical protein [Anaerolineae bacterium]